MRHRYALHLALVFVLLFAQQAGFVHALSHFAPSQLSQVAQGYQASPAQAFAATAGSQPDGKIPEGTRHAYQACAQCLVVTLADGAISTHTRVAPLAAVAALQAATVVLYFSQTATSAFFARGPPVVA